MRREGRAPVLRKSRWLLLKRSENLGDEQHFRCAGLRPAFFGASRIPYACTPVIQRAAPKVLVTLGDDVFSYVSTFTTWDGAVCRLNMPSAPVVIAIPHPNSRKRLSYSELPQVADACREVFLDRLPTVWDFRTHRSGAPSAGQNQLHRIFEWSDRYGWQVVHQPRDLGWLEADANRVIMYLLYKAGKLRHKMVLNGAQLRQAITWREWPAKPYVNPVTRTAEHQRTEQFLPQWAPFVVKLD